MKAFLLLIALCWQSFAACVPPPNTYDSDARGYEATIRGQGGSLASATYIDVTRFARLAKQWGLRERIVRLNLYCGNDTNGCKVVLFGEAVGGTTDTISSFVAADYSESTGLTGDTTTKQLVVGGSMQFASNPPFTSRNDLHFAVYNRTDGTSPGYVIGTQDGSTQVAMLLKYTDNNTYLRMGNLATFVQTNETSVLGWYMGVRTSDSSCDFYHNGVLMANYSPGSSALPSLAINVHAANVSGVPARSARTLAGYSLGYSMTSTQVANYYLLMQWFQKARGRGV